MVPFVLAHDAKLQKIECLENQIIVCADLQVPDIQTQELFFLAKFCLFHTPSQRTDPTYQVY